MGPQARIFVDYWNFQLNWNERSNDARCDWLALPWALLRGAERIARIGDISYGGTHIYASVDPGNDNLLNWLETFLDRQPGFKITTSKMIRRQRGTRCSSCGFEQESCPECGEPYTQSLTKGLSTSLVCDLLTLSGERDAVPIVVSSDTELSPAFAALMARGVKVLHGSWRDSGLELAREAWGSIELDQLIPELIRG